MSSQSQQAGGGGASTGSTSERSARTNGSANVNNDDDDDDDADCVNCGGNDATAIDTETATVPVEKCRSIAPETDLSDPSRRIWIVTTAALPWRTGTSVNPLMRALFLTRGRPKHHVTLVVPWLEDEESRRALYGEENAFCEEDGQAKQEGWIREYCRSRAHCHEEEKNLRIMFWNGRYVDAFKSIFPTVDICGLIPKEEADIAILEEPEHLNWFRVPAPRSDEKAGAVVDADYEDGRDVELGWVCRFRHVVGIIHTNYGAYIRQYGWAHSIVSEPVLNRLSSLMVRAYCVKAIRLSATVPSYDASKEVTCNVHGVRSEFLECNNKPSAVSSQDASCGDTCAPVYFVGKVIWAKGFDLLLELQETYRATVGEYFPMDVYGGGDDMKAIQRAFFGRRRGEGYTGATNSTTTAARGGSGGGADGSTFADQDQRAADVFERRGSLRKIIEDEAMTRGNQNSDESAEEEEENEEAQDDIAASSFGGGEEKKESGSSALEVIGDLSKKGIDAGAEAADAGLRIIDAIFASFPSRTRKADRGDGKGVPTSEDAATFKGKTWKEQDQTASEETVTAQQDEKSAPDEPLAITKQQPTPNAPRKFLFVPPLARFKWRRTPLPARFHGVRDHVIVRDIPEQKIFLNMSTTEVLCTTSAEAIAMGKFVILPRHPSNEFFYQFTNCLPYGNLDECVERLRYALGNVPAALSEEESHLISWEGATERLFQVSSMTEEEKLQRKQSGKVEEDLRAARFHVESAKGSRFVGSLLSGKAFC